MVLISTKQLHLPSPSTLVSMMFYRQETQAHGDVRADLWVGAMVSSVGLGHYFSSDCCTWRLLHLFLLGKLGDRGKLASP